MPGEYGLESLLFEIAAAFEAGGHSMVADHPDGDFRAGLLDLLQEPALVIVDDFDQLLAPETRLPDSSVLDFIRTVGRKAGDGRLVLVTSESPSEGPWLEDAAIKTMAPPSDDDAVSLLRRLLKDRGLTQEVAERSLGDIASWLGRNPRAMQAFVACLREEPVQNLIDLDVEAWDLRDQVVSPQLVQRLERQFLEKTIGRLDASTVVGLENAAVYRKPFLVEALASAAPHGAKPEVMKDALISRFLITRVGRWYSVNPVARQLSISRLSATERRRVAAHSLAADHFVKRVRPSGFRDLVRAGSDFVEARYHLLESGRDNHFQGMASEYRDLLLANYQALSRVPTDPRAASQLLATLVAALADSGEGHHRLRYVMAQLLTARGRADDERLAYRQVGLATRQLKDPAAWILRAKLAARLDTARAVSAIGHQALQGLSSGGAVQVLDQAIQELVERNERDLALQLINAGLESLPPAHKLRILSVGAFVLCGMEAHADAVRLLLDGYTEIGPAVKYSWRLFEQAAFIAFAQGDGRSVSRARDAILAQGINEHQPSLCDILSLQLQGRYEAAAVLGESHLGYPTVAAQVAFCWLVEGDPDRALKAYEAGRLQSNSATCWLRGLIAAQQGAADVYFEAMGQAAAGVVEMSDTRDPLAWALIWAESPRWITVFPAFYFPRLPAKLTGLADEVIRESEVGSEWIMSALRAQNLTPIKIVLGQEDSSEQEIEPRTTGAAGGIVVNVNLQGREERSMGETYNVYGPAGSVGRGARASDFVIINGETATRPIDRDRLVSELTELIRVVKSSPTAERPMRVVEALAEAVESAEDGDDEQLGGALRRAGRWALDRANEVGVSVAAAAIEASMGLGG
ncbi:hypothetical protein ACU610_00675 [Geodermatophilus sp. URMC 61]|uniref:hypothetical protein n=1 Tax=Geodermatophilus sp. URMC 61 TaxID=3423411 RepID=UPI00406C9B79